MKVCRAMQSPFVTTYLEIIEGHKYESEQADICEEMIKQRLEGMKNEKGQIIGETFPKLVYVLEEHNSLQGGKYDYITELCIDCNIKRLVPDYQSGPIMRRNYEGNNFPPMGCRSHLSPWKDADGNYKFYGRFNQGVVSLNLPQIALIAEGNMNVAMPLLDERLELCFEALMFRHNSLLGTKSDVSPIHWQHGALARLKPGEVIDPLLKNGYSTISLGYVGIHEFVQRMIGESHTTKKGQELALMILDHLKAACDKWKKETGLGFGLYGTPGESLTSRFCSIDTKRFGVIKNVTDRKFYTNSYHVHVEQEIDAFEKLEFEAQFHKISSGGCISYIESPDLSKNKEPLRQIVRHIFKHVQYGEINTRPDVCYCCGFEGEIKLNENMKWQCPECENNDHGQMQVMRRTCGLNIGSH